VTDLERLDRLEHRVEACERDIVRLSGLVTDALNRIDVVMAEVGQMLPEIGEILPKIEATNRLALGRIFLQVESSFAELQKTIAGLRGGRTDN
jgi:hypothetical protein